MKTYSPLTEYFIIKVTHAKTIKGLEWSGFSSGHVWVWELNYKESRPPKNWCFWTVVLEKTLRVPWTARSSNQSILKEIILGFLWKEWCLSWNSSTLSTSCKELTHWKRLWCWEGLGVGGEGDDQGWDGCMASLTRWTWVWVNSGSWWWTGRPGCCDSWDCRVRYDWATELNWTERKGNIPRIRKRVKSNNVLK